MVRLPKSKVSMSSPMIKPILKEKISTSSLEGSPLKAIPESKSS